MIKTKALFACKHCFFDFFGTIMFRNCSANDIKKIWASRLSKLLGQRVSSDILYEIRITCELLLAGQNNREFIYEELVSLIHDRVNDICNDKNGFIDKQSFVNKSVEIETYIEKEKQQVNTEIINLIKELKDKGKKVYILSDFYFGSSVLKNFLEDKNIDIEFDGVFVSCELGLNKLNGELYKVLLKRLNFLAKDCFMIGDNRKSDYINAKKTGLEAYCIGENGSFGKNINSFKILSKLLTKKTKNAVNYSNFAFSLFKFIETLYDELYCNQYEQVFFFSREGELLKKLFDDYCAVVHKKLGLPIVESKYLYVSRQSTYVAGLQDIREETFATLFSEYKNLSIKAFLNNIGFSVEDVEIIRKKIDVDIEKQIEEIKASKELYELVNNKTFCDIYSRTVVKAKDSLVKYLGQQGFYEKEKVAVVDVGWKGSIQDNIYKASILKNITIQGYYYGLTEKTKTAERNKKKGLMFSNYPYRSQDFRIWSFDYNFLERLLTASHPSTKAYKENNGHFEPEFNEFGREKANYELILPLQQSIQSLFVNISEVLYDLPLLSAEKYEFFRRVHLRTCCKVTKDDIRLQHRLLSGQMENFGYQTGAAERMDRVFSFKNILKKIKNNYRVLKEPLKIAKVLMVKKLYFISSRIYRMQYKKLLKGAK